MQNKIASCKIKVRFAKKSASCKIKVRVAKQKCELHNKSASCKIKSRFANNITSLLQDKKSQSVKFILSETNKVEDCIIL